MPRIIQIICFRTYITFPGLSHAWNRVRKRMGSCSLRPIMSATIHTRSCSASDHTEIHEMGNRRSKRHCADKPDTSRLRNCSPQGLPSPRNGRHHAARRSPVQEDSPIFEYAPPLPFPLQLLLPAPTPRHHEQVTAVSSTSKRVECAVSMTLTIGLFHTKKNI